MQRKYTIAFLFNPLRPQSGVSEGFVSRALTRSHSSPALSQCLPPAVLKEEEGQLCELSATHKTAEPSGGAHPSFV